MALRDLPDASIIQIAECRAAVISQSRLFKNLVNRMEGICRNLALKETTAEIIQDVKTIDGFGPRIHYEALQLDRMLNVLLKLLEAELAAHGDSEKTIH